MSDATAQLRSAFRSFIQTTQLTYQLLFAKMNLPVSISFLARNAPLLSDSFGPDAVLYNRALPGAEYTAYCNIRIQPKLSQCFSLRISRPPNLNDIQIALRYQLSGLAVERLALRVAVCSVNRKSDLLKIKAVSNCCYFYYWKDAKSLQFLPVQSKAEGVDQKSAEGVELLVRADIVDRFQFLLFEFTTLISCPAVSPDAKYEVCLAHSVCSLSETRFADNEIPSTQTELYVLFERVDGTCLVNKYATLFKALKATEKRYLQELSSLGEAKKQSVFVWKSYALPVYKGSFLTPGDKLEASKNKVTRKAPNYKFETLRLSIGSVAFKDRNRLVRMPDTAIIPQAWLRFLDHTAALVCNYKVVEFFKERRLPGNYFQIALKFIRANDPPPYLLLKGVLHFKNSVALYAASCKFRDVYKQSAEYVKAKQIVIEPRKYEYCCKLLLADFLQFLDENEAMAIANCGYIRPAGEWKAIAREWR